MWRRQECISEQLQSCHYCPCAFICQPINLALAIHREGRRRDVESEAFQLFHGIGMPSSLLHLLLRLSFKVEIRKRSGSDNVYLQMLCFAQLMQFFALSSILQPISIVSPSSFLGICLFFPSFAHFSAGLVSCIFSKPSVSIVIINLCSLLQIQIFKFVFLYRILCHKKFESLYSQICLSLFQLLRFWS